MPWWLPMVLGKVLDILLPILLEVARDKAKDTKSEWDDKMVSAFENEQDGLKDLIKSKLKK